jgi:hypothetical protein
MKIISTLLCAFAAGHLALQSVSQASAGPIMAPRVSAPTAAPIAAPKTAMGTHGMAVFGGLDGLYASHLPMFHTPHDFQVVLKFHLQDAAVDAALRLALSQQATLWTLEPERFDLLKLSAQVQPLTHFQARIVQGHFERGGSEKWREQAVVVDSVLIFRTLSATQRTRSAGKYYLIGTPAEAFMIKEIDRRPDFDVIVALAPIAAKSRYQLTKRWPAIPWCSHRRQAWKNYCAPCPLRCAACCILKLRTCNEPGFFIRKIRV